MAYIQRTSPPPNEILTFSLVNFSGGLNNRSEILLPNQCSDVLNMAFNNDTVMEKRRGTTYFDTLTLSGEVIFIDEYKPYNDTDILIRGTATELWFGTVKVMNVVGTYTGVNFMGKYFVADGDKLRVYGKFPQVSTEPYEEVVGTPTPNYTVFQVANPPSDFTPLDNTHVKGKTVYNYTTGQVWYEPCELELEDTFKNGNVLPEKARFLAVKGGRLFASGSDKDNDSVFITDIHNPYYFPATLPMQLPPNSDRVVGLHMYDDAIIVGRRNDIYAIKGTTNRTDLGLEVFSLKQLNSHAGWASHWAVNRAHNYLFFLGSDGNAYSLGTSRSTAEGYLTTILTKNIDLFREPINIVKNDIWTAKSIFYNDQWYVTIKDKILIYSYRHMGWTMYNNIHARSFYEFLDVLIWGDKNGRICMPSEDYLDHGIPYEAYWTSKNFDMDDANSNKQFREFFIVAHTFNDVDSDIRITFDVDYVDVKSNVSISNQISIWGKAVWGDRFINRNINASLPFTIGRRGRQIRFTFRNGYFPSAPVETRDDLESYIGRSDGKLVYVLDEENYYLYNEYEWHLVTLRDLNQGMRIYQVNGEYELRGKR